LRCQARVASAQFRRAVRWTSASHQRSPDPGVVELSRGDARSR
jgi:hypothetical protein